jgi:hypothetical protein
MSRLRSPRLPLGQLLGVHGTGLVLIEAVLQRVPQAVELEPLRATGIGTVEERAMRYGF